VTLSGSAYWQNQQGTRRTRELVATRHANAPSDELIVKCGRDWQNVQWPTYISSVTLKPRLAASFLNEFCADSHAGSIDIAVSAFHAEACSAGRG
jgi:hypothetical protein